MRKTQIAVSLFAMLLSSPAFGQTAGMPSFQGLI